MTTIDHSQHDHPATKEARAACRATLERYPRGERPGTVFRDGEGNLWQRLLLGPENVQYHDYVAGFEVIGTSADARHDNAPAYRFDLAQGDHTGRLVVQGPRTTLEVYRPFDPETADMFVDLDIESTDAEFVLREVFDLVSQTMVIPKLLTMAGPGGYPIVRFIGPKKDMPTVLKRYSPGGWEDLLLEVEPVHETPDPAEEPGFGSTQGHKYNFMDWQRERIETLLGAHNSKRWAPTRFVLPPDAKHRKTIFNQPVRDGWALRLPGVPDSTRYVGRELMKALIEQYPHLLDLPEGFQP